MNTLLNKIEDETVLDSNLDILVNFISTNSFNLLKLYHINKIRELTSLNFKKILELNDILNNEKKEIEELINIKEKNLRFFKELINDKKYYENNVDRSNLKQFEKEDEYNRLDLIPSNFSSETLDYLDSINITTYGQLLEINLSDVKNLNGPLIRTKKKIYDTILKLKLDPSFLDDYNDRYEMDLDDDDIDYD